MVTQAIVFYVTKNPRLSVAKYCFVDNKRLNDRSGLSDDKGKNYTEPVGRKT